MGVLRAISIVLVILLPLRALADSIPVFTIKPPTQNEYELSGSFESLIDSGHNYSLEEILAAPTIQDQFIQGPLIIPWYKNQDVVIWKRMRLNNTLQEPAFYVFHQHGNMDSFEVFLIDQNGTVIYRQTGNAQVVQDKPVREIGQFFYLTLEPGRYKDIYIRIHNSGKFLVEHLNHQFLYDQKYLPLRFLGHEHFQFFYFGISLLLTLTGLVLVSSFRNWLYGIIAGPVFMIAVYFFFYYGYFSQLAGISHNTSLYILNVLIVPLLYLSQFLFFYFYLNIDVYLKKTGIIIFCLLIAAIVLTIAAHVFQSSLILTIANLTTLLLITGYLISSIYLAFKGDRKALIFVIFMFALYWGGAAFLLSLIDVIPPGKLNGSLTFQIGSLVAGFIISYLFYDLVEQTIKDRRQAEANELTALQEKKTLIQEQNRLLEEKVMQRTAQLEEEQQRANSEREKAETLLLNILPAKIAEELKNNGTAKAKLHPEITVLFADIKNFTLDSEKLSPEELVAEIDYYYRNFDKIVKECGVEKIKTVGDAYICAAGFIGGAVKAKTVVEAALKMRSFVGHTKMEREERNLPYFEFRFGIHTGSVVAGVVGEIKFAYDIWGDTVNTAARFEQNSEAGKINISQTTYELVKDEFTCIPRGKINAKNKGEIEMYFVEYKKEVRV